jgi:hypothetical protein
MVSKEEILELIRACFLSPVLLYAEAALPEKQFHAYRKLVLDQFGRFGKELDKLYQSKRQRAG